MTTQAFPMLSHLCKVISGNILDLFFSFGTISSAKPILIKMNINDKISSYTNLIDFLNSERKGLTLEPPTPAPPK